MLEHQHLVAAAMASAPPEPPSPVTAIIGRAERQASLHRAGDGLGLAALLGADAGVGAGGVDEARAPAA